MKKRFIITVICICAPLMAYCSPLSMPGGPGDSSISDGQPSLTVSGTRVYNNDQLLSRSEVLNILSATPDFAAQYERATRTRSTGTALLVGGGAIMAGGIVLMVSGIQTYTDYYGYSMIDYNDKYYAGLVIGTIGELMLDAGIACTIIGKTKIHRSIRNYNNAMQQGWVAPLTVNYQLGMLDNGNFGFKITF